MKNIRPILFFATILSIIIIFSLKDNKSITYDFDPDSLLANISRIWVKPKVTEPVLENYPFTLMNPPVIIAEAFEAYDGYLGDKIGDYHWGIDYVQFDGDKFLPFPVYSAHAGIAFQGNGKTWGKFVVIRKRDDLGKGYNTLYSHLENVPKYIPYMDSDIDNSKGVFIESMAYIGDAGVTGNVKNGINQLHFEFHRVDSNKKTLRLDPYGLYKRLSSDLYPQPGQSLQDIDHYWNSDLPEFAK